MSESISTKKLPLEIRQEWEKPIVRIEVKYVVDELIELGFKDFLANMSKGQFTQVVQSLTCWGIGVEWFLKEELFGKDYKIIGKRSTINAYKPLGQLLCQVLKLIERCRTLSASREIYFTPVPEYFASYVQECKAAQIRSIQRRPVLDTTLAIPNTKVGKTEQAKPVQKFIELLDRRQNPYNPFNLHQARRYLLMKAAIQLSHKFSQFRDDYWKPYVTAERKWLRHQQRSLFFQDFWIELDEDSHQKLCVGNGQQGRGKLNFPFT